MTDAFSILDWGIVGGTAALSVIGLFLGFGGQVGTVAGFAAAAAAGYFLHGLALQCVLAMGFAAGTAGMPAIVLDAVFALLAFGLARTAVKRFVRGCLGPLANSLLGALVGLLLGGAAVGFMAGIGTSAPNTHGQTPFAEQSVIVRAVAAWADGGRPAARPDAAPDGDAP